MKQFILKNIVLAAILVLTLISSVFLIFFIWNKSQMIRESMADIDNDDQTLESINMARKPNSVEQSEKMINSDTDTLTKKNVQIYRHFGKPYRPALLKFLANIASTAELKANLPVDPTLVAKPKAKPETESDEDEEDAENEDEETPSAPATPGAPTDEEKAVFDPSSHRVILSFDEDTVRAMLAELYSDVHQDTDDDTFVIPDTIQAERAQLFSRLFDEMIEAPEAVDPARAEDFRKEAAAKFAQAFALFREDVQALTYEDVTDRVAKELFLDALGLPRLMRQRDCKNYIDFLYQKYLASDMIPGLSPDEAVFDRESIVQDLIYGKNLNRQALPVPEMVIPIIRNFQIKEDLFRRMKETGVKKLNSMNAGVFYGSPLDSNDTESPVLVFTYTIDMTSTLESIDAFINSLHAAYKSDRVYVIRDIKLTAPHDDLVMANYLVAGHIDGTNGVRNANSKEGDEDKDKEEEDDDNKPKTDPATALITAAYSQFELTDPQHPDYGKVLLGETRDEINCTLVVNYLFYRADNITPQ